MYSVEVPLGSVRRAAGSGPIAHASPQTTVAFSPDGSHYASGGYDGRVVVWDTADGTPRWTGRHQRLVNSVRFSPSGRLLASCGADKVCRVWRVRDGALVDLLSRQPDDLNALAWLSDERLAAVSQDGTGRIWEVGSGRLEDVVLMHTDHCMSVDASAAGLLASCGEDATIRLWAEDGTPIRVLREAGHAEMCRWSPDGALLAASCDDGYVHILEPNGELAAKIGPYTAAVKSVAWSQDSACLAVGAYDCTVRLWERDGARQLVRWQGAHLWPRSLDWSVDGRTLIVGTISGAPQLLEVPELPLDATAADAEPIRIEVAASSWTNGVNHLSAEAGALAAGRDDGAVALWRADGSALHLPVGNGSLVNAVALCPGAPDLLAYGTFSGLVGVVDLAAGNGPLYEIRGEFPINRVVWSPGGDRLSVADYEGDLRTFAWDGRALSEISVYSGHSGAIKDFSWVDEDRIVTISTDHTAHLIEADARLVRSFTGHGELVNSGSVTRIGGRSVLATASRDRTIRLFDLDTGELLQVLIGHDESVKAVAWQPGGEPRLLSGSYDFTGRVWELDPADWSVGSVEVLVGHGNAISSVAWLGQDPVTAGWDGRVLRWHRAPGDGGYAAHAFEEPAR
ncbi:WD40 repeat domain-containing protein [Actinospica durhamensis]|uniref:WD40 repeat domain-containing protein n=1 Tax=Actinospica durhamensis TaxID=1508375 RepID=A0A941IR13_9ACTN|nr:WD40 repeat domain-containing protein [Actinospica durhamensis]MBR7833473.1 WD40 repeat domain-containing protein [Actinospica durhamensis]